MEGMVADSFSHVDFSWSPVQFLNFLTLEALGGQFVLNY